MDCHIYVYALSGHRIIRHQSAYGNHCLSRLPTCRLPVQAISLDFLGVPGSAVASKTLDLVEKHGFPSEKRLGAGVVDGRSVWSDGIVPAALVASLHKKVHACALMLPVLVL